METFQWRYQPEWSRPSRGLSGNKVRVKVFSSLGKRVARRMLRHPMKPEAKRGNPNWGKPLQISAPVVPSSFENLVKALGLAPHQYHESDQLKDWVRKNCHSKYV